MNLKQKTRTKRLKECVKRSGAVGAVTLLNKSCKCDLVSAKEIDIPQAEIEIDMIDRGYADLERAKRQLDVLRESL